MADQFSKKFIFFKFLTSAYTLSDEVKLAYVGENCIFGESTETSGLIHKILQENSETGCSTKLKNEQGHK